MADTPPASTSQPTTCYRHPDRQAGVRCQRCDRHICPSCMTTASVGFHCPECSKKGAQKVHTAGSMFGARPIVTLKWAGIGRKCGDCFLNLTIFMPNQSKTLLTKDIYCRILLIKGSVNDRGQAALYVWFAECRESL